MWMKTKIKIPKSYGPTEREAIALEILEKIVERTQNGKDKNGDKFAPYTKDYKESLNFKLGGKSSKVDLTLSGDMLADMQLLNHKNGEITIGYENGTESNSKAEGNIRGTYGQKVPDKSKARDFLGINKNELGEILSNYPIRDIEQRKERTAKMLAIAESAEDITGQLFIEDLDE